MIKLRVVIWDLMMEELYTNADPDRRYIICIEYEDEQGNDCSTLTLAAGEDKTCTVKNYIRFTNIPL